MKRRGGPDFVRFMSEWRVATGKSSQFGARKTGKFNWAQYKQEYVVKTETRQGSTGLHLTKFAFLKHYKAQLAYHNRDTPGRGPENGMPTLSKPHPEPTFRPLLASVILQVHLYVTPHLSGGEGLDSGTRIEPLERPACRRRVVQEVGQRVQ